jgi:sterol desaturase/sphingolipid hydroxylase (fatty acid hydroxylase superfamily)
MTLPELWAAYLSYPAIDLYAVLTLIFGVYAVISDRHWSSVALPALAVLIVYPLVWYGLHRFVLHGRWLYRMRWSAALWKRIHFDHHQDPQRLEVLFGSPLNTIPTMLVITGPIGYAIGGRTGAAAAFACALVTTSVYEFFHCIQHLNYRPKSRLIQRLKRDHLVHHFQNENGNYGIVSFLPDRLFHSYYPNARDCPKSATVFNLGYDLKQAERYPWVMELTGTPPRDKPLAAAEGNTERPGR